MTHIPHPPRLVRALIALLAAVATALTLTLPHASAATSYSRSAFGINPVQGRNAYDSDGWGTACASTSALASARYTGGSVRVRKELAPLVTLLLQISEKKYGYVIKANQTWGFNCRKIAGSTRLSNHGRGLAVDINSVANPQSYTFTTTIPPAMVQLWTSHGFNWGGYYSYPTRFDTMHFEFADSPASIAGYLSSARAVLAGTKAVPAVKQCPNANLAAFPVLKKGASGTNVLVAQCLLSLSGRAVTLDGVYGSGTSSATSTFESAVGLKADGVIDQRTWVALQASGARTVLERGDKSQDVARLQRALRAAGFSSLKVTGTFDAATVTAVRAYQKRCELVVDGVVGKKTWGALQAGRLT